MTIYFENLIIALQVLYIFKKHVKLIKKEKNVKFHVIQMLFTTRSINLFFMYILDYKNLNLNI